MAYGVPVDHLSAPISLLGVPLDSVTSEEAVVRILAMLAMPVRHHVVTPNNEMLVLAQSHSHFRDVLSRADLRLPDSTGLLLGARMTGQRLPARVTGVDTVTNVCDRLGAEHAVFFLGGKEGAGRKAADALQMRNSALRIAGVHEGSPCSEDAADIIEKINASGAHILFVAFGAPAQDLWIFNHLPALTSVRVAMGVGGTFDFLSGRIRRAPAVMRALGLEWLWRLVLQPSRFGRIWNAVMVFPVLVMLYGKNGKQRG